VLLRLLGRSPLLTTRIEPVDDGDEALTLDLSGLTFASPLDLTGIAALALAHRRTGALVRLMAPVDAGSAAYVQRMDLFRTLGDEVEVLGTMPPDDRSDQSNVLLELRRVPGVAEANDVAAWFGSTAQRMFGELETTPFHMFGELLDNACSHGWSEAGAFAAAQFYTGVTSGRPGLELAICDAGVGVLNHLRRDERHRDLATHASALHRAFDEKTSGAGRHGWGLHEVLKRIGQLDLSSLILGSGDAAIRFRTVGGRSDVIDTTLSMPIAGTWAWLRVRLPRAND
jgi:hypothetical protein